MQELDNIIDYYLKTETNYAIMITGEWGVGKTFYYKNILDRQISQTPTYKDNQKNYKPILVSLFGLKSVEEIQAELFLSLFPILKKKSIKLGIAVGKCLVKGILSLKNLGDYFDFVADIEVDKEQFIKFSDLAICFDDLERASRNFPIEEFIGYINSLVENENVKIIIIANENQIDESKYKLLKEKIVGNSIEFIPDLDKTYDSLIQTKFSSYDTYLSYLKENKQSILEVFSKKTTNLRILSFALIYFQTIFSNILKELPSQEVLKDKQPEILSRLLKFSLIISIEYKEGRISYTKNEDLDLVSGLPLMNLSWLNARQDANKKNEKVEIKKTYKDELIEQFYAEGSYQYFKSIYEFITGGSILKIEDLIQELKSHYHVEEGKILPQFEIYNRLRHPYESTLTDKEYLSLTRELLRYSDQGGFELSFYPTVFIFASRFGNPLRFNLDKLEKRIIIGMKKGMSNYKYDYNLHHYLGISEEEEYKENLKRIISTILDLNEKIRINHQTSDLSRLATKCFEDFDSFNQEVINNKERTYDRIPVFQNFSSYKFYLLFLRSDSKKRWQIIQLFRERYHRHLSVSIKPDINFLEDLKKRIENKNMKIAFNGISKHLFSVFIDVLNSSITNLNNVG